MCILLLDRILIVNESLLRIIYRSYKTTEAWHIFITGLYLLLC